MPGTRCLWSIALVSLLLVLVEKAASDDFGHETKEFQIVSRDTVWHVMAHNFGYDKFAPFSLEMIDTMIVSSRFYSRALAAYVLGEGQIAETSTCLELIISGVQNELDNPTIEGPRWRFKRPITDVIKDQYIFNILYLLGNRNRELLLPLIEKHHGDLRTLLVLAYGAAGAKSVRDEIRSIFLESKDSYIRLSAIKVMNHYPDSLDIPILKKALRDVYSSPDNSWVDSTAFQGMAQGALSKLGYTAEEIEEMRLDKK